MRASSGVQSSWIAAAASLLLAICGGGCLKAQSIGSGDMRVQPVFEGSGPRPQVWLLEYIVGDLGESSWDGAGKETPGALHTSTYRLYELSPEKPVANIPWVMPNWTLMFWPLTGMSHIRYTKGLCYVEGYERTSAEYIPQSASNDRSNGATETPESAGADGIPVSEYKMIPWDVSSREFTIFWFEFSSDQRSVDRVEQWKKLVERKDPAVRRLLEWYVARYVAALEQKPELTREHVQAQHFARVRQLLESMDK